MALIVILLLALLISYLPRRKHIYLTEELRMLVEISRLLLDNSICLNSVLLMSQIKETRVKSPQIKNIAPQNRTPLIFLIVFQEKKSLKSALFKTNKALKIRALLLIVPRAGLEPAQYCYYRILSTSFWRHSQSFRCILDTKSCKIKQNRT